MKITMVETTIEANGEELSRSNSLAESFSNVLRGAFNNVSTGRYGEEEEVDDESDE